MLKQEALISGRTREEKKDITRFLVQEVFNDLMKTVPGNTGRLRSVEYEDILEGLLEKIEQKVAESEVDYGFDGNFDIDKKDVRDAVKWMHYNGRAVVSRKSRMNGRDTDMLAFRRYDQTL